LILIQQLGPRWLEKDEDAPDLDAVIEEVVSNITEGLAETKSRFAKRNQSMPALLPTEHLHRSFRQPETGPPNAMLAKRAISECAMRPGGGFDLGAAAGEDSFSGSSCFRSASARKPEWSATAPSPAFAVRNRYGLENPLAA
jgi:hypothetical protein